MTGSSDDLKGKGSNISQLNCKTALAIAIAVLAVIFVISMIPDGTSAETQGQCGDDLTWSYYTSSGALTITGSGDMYDFTSGNHWGGNTIKSVSLPDGLTHIGDSAFAECRDLTSITIPDTVISIGDGAFFECTSMASVSIGNHVTSIGDSAFLGCKPLITITIPDSVISIGSNVFSRCSSLESISVGDANVNYSSDNGILFNKNGTTLIQYPEGKGDTTYVIPTKVTSIGSYAFYRCSHLASVTIPGSVTEIKDYAFFGCSSLTSITIPDKIKVIEKYTFSDCGSLTSVTIPDSVTAIGNGAFYDCKSLTTITIPGSVTNIGGSAFFGCSSLTSITIPDSVTTIGNSTFSGCIALTSVTLGKHVESIGNYAFYRCSSITGIAIPGSVKSIGENVFNMCRSLSSIIVDNSNMYFTSKDGVLFDKDVTMMIKYPAAKTGTSYSVPGSVENIRELAFDGCSYLTSISIPGSVNLIMDNTFYGCSSLTSVTVDGSNTDYTSVDGILYNKDMTALILYPAAKADQSYALPDSVEEIWKNALLGCGSLASISVGSANAYFTSVDGVLYTKDMTAIVKYPAAKTEQSYALPDSVSLMWDGAFLYADSLREITVGENNQRFSSVNGCLFDKQGTTLYVCPSNLESLEIPEGLSFITRYAFSGDGLKEVVFPKGSDPFVYTNAFYNCGSLDKIVIRDGSDVFFEPSSVVYTDNDHHKIHVIATSGYTIEKNVFYGNVEVIYGEQYDYDTNVAFIAVGVIAVVIVLGLAFFLIRRHS